MKKILFLLTLFISLVASAQTPPVFRNPWNWLPGNKLKLDSLKIGDSVLTAAKIAAMSTVNGLYELTANKSTNTSLGSSNTLFPTQNAVKSYVDNTAAGQTPKAPVDYATAAALAANTYANGTSGVGATITITATGTLTIDGHVTALNENILIKDESTQSHNGIYTVTTAGAVGVQAVLTRRTDFDQSAEVVKGAFTLVINGTANASKVFTQNSSVTTMGTDAITFVQTGGATGSTTWGSITGTLSSQTDLQNALDLKANLISPSFTTPTLGVATATTINKVTITQPATGSTLTIDDGFTLHATGNVTALSGSHTGTSSGTNTGDQTSVSGNAGTATALQTARAINGVNFDGTAPITVTAAAGTLTGTTLASNVVTSSLTTVGTLATGSTTGSFVIGGATMTLGSDATGDIYFRNASGNLARIAAGSQNTILKMGASSTPAWTTETFATPGTSGNVMTSNGTNWTSAAPAAAAAGSLTGSTLASGVTASSLTSFGNSPTLVTPNIGAATGTSLVLSSFLNEAKGADIASATTTDIGAATGNYVHVTGTTTITGLGTVQAGTRRIVKFTGALTLTYNSVSLILPGAANITTVNGDVAEFVSLGSGNWICTSYVPTTVTGTGSTVLATSPTLTTPSFTTGFKIGGAASSGLFIVGNGTNFVASTSTIPTSAGSTANKVLLSDGTNYALSTPTFPNASATSGKTIRSDGTNWIASTATLSDAPSTALKWLRSDGTNWITSTSTLAEGAVTSGKVLVSDGTNWVASTPTFPNASATSRKIIVSDGTNWVASAETWPVATTSGNQMIADGTNWVSTATRSNWSSLVVSGSDFTTTNATLTNITGLVSGTLATATLYEFECVLYVNSSTTAGVEVGVQQGGTGSGQIGVFNGVATNAAATSLAIGSNALNTASAACVLVNGDGQITIKGFIKTGTTGTPTISAQILKLTSGTAKVYIGSVMRYRVAN